MEVSGSTPDGSTNKEVNSTFTAKISHPMRHTRRHTYSDESGVYDVYTIIDFSKKSVSQLIPLQQLMHNLEQYCWGDDTYKIRPKDLLTTRRTELDRYHYQKSLHSDLRHPIILNNDLTVIDGMHRLLKATIVGKHSIRGVIIDRIPKSALIQKK